MLLYDPVGYGKTESGTLTGHFGSEEGVIDPGKVLGQNSLPGVNNFYSCGGLIAACANRQRAAAVHRVARIKNQIQKDLLQLSGVAADDRRRALKVHHDSHLRTFYLMPDQG